MVERKFPVWLRKISVFQLLFPSYPSQTQYNKTTNEVLMNTNNENSKDKNEKSNKHLKTAIIPLYNILERL